MTSVTDTLNGRPIVYNEGADKDANTVYFIPAELIPHLDTTKPIGLVELFKAMRALEAEASA